MRPLVFVASLIGLLAALALLVADSVGPCEDFEDVDISYDFVFACDGEPYASGTVRFSIPESYRGLEATSLTVDWVREVVDDGAGNGEEETGGNGQGEQENGAEEESGLENPIEFVIARAKVDYSDCSPGKGTGAYLDAWAEVTARVADPPVSDFEEDTGLRIFSCQVLRNKEAIAGQECTPGEVRWPGPDGEIEEIEAPFEDCSLRLVTPPSGGE